MTGPDRRVLMALDRRRTLDRDGLRGTTHLAAATIEVTLRKLARMRLVAETGDGRFELTAKGRRAAKAERAPR